MCIFLPSISGSKTEQIIGYTHFFAPKQEKTEETMDYTYSFLQCKEAKPQKRYLMQIPFFNLKKQNGGNHWLYRLKEGISVSHALLGFEYLNWRKECVSTGVSSVFLPQIEKRNMYNSWCPEFWFLKLRAESCITNGFLPFPSLDWRKEFA